MVEREVVSLIPGAGLKYLGSDGTVFTLQITIPSHDLNCLLRWHSLLQQGLKGKSQLANKHPPPL